jgi:hypothetical protein
VKTIVLQELARACKPLPVIPRGMPLGKTLQDLLRELILGHVELVTGNKNWSWGTLNWSLVSIKIEFYKNSSQNQLVRLVMTRLVTKATKPNFLNAKYRIKTC